MVFLGEAHLNDTIRIHLAAYAYARKLKEAGIIHYAIEAYERGNDVFDRLNKGESVDLSGVDVGPAVSRVVDPDYAAQVRANYYF